MPSIEIEAYFSSLKEDEVAIKKFKGTNNSLHEDTEGVKVEIIFDTQYASAYKQLLAEKKVKDKSLEFTPEFIRDYIISRLSKNCDFLFNELDYKLFTPYPVFRGDNSDKKYYAGWGAHGGSQNITYLDGNVQTVTL